MLSITPRRIGSFRPEVDRANAGRVRAVRVGTFLLEGMIAARAPVDTGFLQASVSSRFDGQVGVVTVGAEYGAYVNYGTRFQSAQPFFDDAVNEFRPVWPSIVRREVVG